MTRHLTKSLAAAAAFALALSSAPVLATQANLVQPIVGPHSMADLNTNYLNPALAALASNNAGSTAPANGPGSVPYTYQWWLNTSTSPPQLEIWDGASWDVVGGLTGSGVFGVPAANINAGLTAPGPIGSVTPNTGAFTTESATISLITPTIYGGALAGQLLTIDTTTAGSPSGDKLLIEADLFQLETQAAANVLDYGVTTPATLTDAATTNFTSAFKVGGFTMTWPGSAATIGGVNVAETVSALWTFNASDLAIGGGSVTAGPVVANASGVESTEANLTVAQEAKFVQAQTMSFARIFKAGTL
jgi:hypothetical protein